jgi:hypothetical protein
MQRLFKQIEAAHTGGVGEQVGMPFDQVNHAALGRPVVGETTKMREHERDAGVRLRQQA